MTPAPVRQHATRSRAAAFSLVEVIFALLLVGGVFVAAINTLAASRTTQRITADRARAHMLAQDLMSEILLAHYEEPVLSPSFGPEGSESVGGTRTSFDDVDDYDGWSASPPQQQDGAPVEGYAGLRRSVSVQWIDADQPTEAVQYETGAKRITVQVHRGEARLAELVAVRTQAWPAMEVQVEAISP